jgi:hypothetical protein
MSLNSSVQPLKPDRSPGTPATKVRERDPLSTAKHRIQQTKNFSPSMIMSYESPVQVPEVPGWPKGLQVLGVDPGRTRGRSFNCTADGLGRIKRILSREGTSPCLLCPEGVRMCSGSSGGRVSPSVAKNRSRGHVDEFTSSISMSPRRNMECKR